MTETLLVLDAFVESQEDVKTLLLGKSQEFTILLARKSCLWNRRTSLPINLFLNFLGMHSSSKTLI
jgi:hypothetical protein